MILVTAATGELGNHVIRKLLERVPPEKVAVAVRNPGKAHHFAARGVTVRQADYDDPRSWIPALVDVDRLLLVSSPEVDLVKRLAQHQRVIDAAAALSVRLIAYTSFIGADKPCSSGLHAHYLTERALEQSGLGYTLLRNPLHTESVLPKEFLQESVESGVVKSAAGKRSVNSATRADLAEAAAVVLTSEGHEGRAYDLVGPPWTFPQLAALLTRLTGQPIEPRDVPPEDMGARAWMFRLIAEGFFERDAPHLAELAGRRLIDLDQYVKTVLGLGITKDPVLRESAWQR